MFNRLMFAVVVVAAGLTGCAQQHQTAHQQTLMRLDQLESEIKEIRATNEQLLAYAERLDTILDEVHAEPSVNAVASSLQSQLQTVRSQIELYKNQHNGQPPNLLQGWDQLTRRTDAVGNAVEHKAFRYGPYLQKPAVNPFTQSSLVTSIDDVHPDAGWAWDADNQILYAVVSEEDAAEAGFDGQDVVTYDGELLRRISALKGDLAVLRNAIDLYATEHAGQYPSLAIINDQLTMYTDTRGQTSKHKAGRFVYGPYIRKVPDNPFTAKHGFSPLQKPSADSAWAYDEESGVIVAVIPQATGHQMLQSRLRGDWIAPKVEAADAGR